LDWKKNTFTKTKKIQKKIETSIFFNLLILFIYDWAFFVIMAVLLFNKETKIFVYENVFLVNCNWEDENHKIIFFLLVIPCNDQNILFFSIGCLGVPPHRTVKKPRISGAINHFESKYLPE
jgi:hypothetical protein